MEEINRFIENYIRENPSGSRTNVVTTIPVVFHIVHNGDAVGTNENIADTYIYAQLQQLNDDYRRLNADAGNTPAEFSGISADLEIQFCLAQQDPNGLPTTGIMRHDLGVASWTVNNFETTAKPATVWDRDSYLNFWTCVFGGGDAGLLAYAQFPGGDPTTDGVVCLYSSVGSISTPNPAGSPYDIGRTATHEIGHWLDLFHIWGDDGTACTGSDLVSDTPNAAGPYFGCPTYPSSSCSSSDMFMNYMDYTDDACMNAFTQGQKIRVAAVVAGPRASLLSSVGCQAAVPIVSFAIEENNVVEGTSNCNSAGFRNVNVVVSLSIPATGTTSVVITANAGSTADFDDYLLNSSSVTFPSGDNTDKMVSLTIYEDAYIESDESIILDILSVSGSDVVAGTQGECCG